MERAEKKTTFLTLLQPLRPSHTFSQAWNRKVRKFCHITMQCNAYDELRMLSSSLSACQSLKVMIRVSQFVRHSQLCHCVTKSLNHCLCLCLHVGHTISSHPSDHLAERSYVLSQLGSALKTLKSLTDSETRSPIELSWTTKNNDDEYTIYIFEYSKGRELGLV